LHCWWNYFHGSIYIPVTLGTVRKETVMKGYITQNGYMGYINGTYILFATEQDYKEYMED